MLSTGFQLSCSRFAHKSGLRLMLYVVLVRASKQRGEGERNAGMEAVEEREIGGDGEDDWLV